MNIIRQNQLFWKRHPLVMGAIGISYALVFGLVIAMYAILSPRHVGRGVFKVMGAEASAQVSEESGDSIIRSASAAQDSVPAQVKVKKPSPRATPELIKTMATLQWAPPGNVIDTGEHTASNDYQNLPPGQYDVAAVPTVDIDRELSRLASR